MGNGNSTIVAVTENCQGLQFRPFLPISVSILLLIFVPLLIHAFKGEKKIHELVSISETWRLPGVGWFLILILVLTLIINTICLAEYLLIILWLGCFLIGLVGTFNPFDVTEYTGLDEPGKNRIMCRRQAHSILSFILFLYILVLALTIVSTTLLGNAGAIFIMIWMCISFVVLIVMATCWDGKTSFFEIFYCSLFAILLGLIDEASVH